MAVQGRKSPHVAWSDTKQITLQSSDAKKAISLDASISKMLRAKQTKNSTKQIPEQHRTQIIDNLLAKNNYVAYRGLNFTFADRLMDFVERLNAGDGSKPADYIHPRWYDPRQSLSIDVNVALQYAEPAMNQSYHTNRPYGILLKLDTKKLNCQHFEYAEFNNDLLSIWCDQLNKQSVLATVLFDGKVPFQQSPAIYYIIGFPDAEQVKILIRG